MVAFDPTEAAAAYSTLDTVELVRIAYLESAYLPEAKAIALRELERRGIPRDCDELIDDARAHIEFRRDSAEMLAYANLDKAQRLQDRIAEVVFIGALWVFAPIAPAILNRSGSISFDWKTVALVLGWVAVAIYAARKKSGGEPRLFQLVVVVPALLFLLGTAYQLFK